MAGHSKWANIRHRKGAQDAKRGKIFTKLIKELTVSVKTGPGADPEMNPRLRLAIQNAKGQNMPKDTIERAIKKAAGEGGDDYIEVTFEGYAIDGVAVFVECATDNNQRTVSSIRSYFKKHGGNLGKDGCLEFVFNRIGSFVIDSEGLDEDDFTLEMIDCGAEDVVFDGESVEVTCSMEDFGNMQKKLAELSIEPKESGLIRVPTTTKETDKPTFDKIMNLVEIIEDDDDVLKVYHNLEFNEEFID